jgi:sugar/nucleoside kinase (ribokinase family)
MQKEQGRWDTREAVVRANKAAAISVMKMGAQGGIPWGEEIDGFDAPFCDEGL